jgi:hypothetical protein
MLEIVTVVFDVIPEPSYAKEMSVDEAVSSYEK